MTFKFENVVGKGKINKITPYYYVILDEKSGDNLMIPCSAVKNADAVCNGYMTLRKKGGGVSKVYKGDKVEYKGHSFTVKEVGSPQMDKITLDADGDSLVVKGTDSQLFAVNAEPVAKNGSYSTQTAIQELTKAIMSLDMAESCLNLHPEIASKIEKAHKMLVESRNEAKKTVIDPPDK